MTKNNTKKSNKSVSKPNFDKMFNKVLKETPKQAVEIKKHEFKSKKIQNVVIKTQTSIAEIPNRLPKTEVKRLEKEFEGSKLVGRIALYEEKDELSELTPEQMQILGSQKYIMWLDNPKNKIINDKNRKGNLTKPSEKREKAFKKLQKEGKSWKSSFGSIGLNADLADKAVMESVISYYIDQNLKGILTNKGFAYEKAAKLLKNCEGNFETQGETYSFSKGILKSVGQVNSFALKTMGSSTFDRLNIKFITEELIDMGYKKQVDKLKELLEKREMLKHDYKINYLWLKRMYAKAKITAEIAEKYSRKLKKNNERELFNLRIQVQRRKDKFNKDDLKVLSDKFDFEKEIAKFRTEEIGETYTDLYTGTIFHE